MMTELPQSTLPPSTPSTFTPSTQSLHNSKSSSNQSPHNNQPHAISTSQSNLLSRSTIVTSISTSNINQLAQSSKIDFVQSSPKTFTSPSQKQTVDTTMKNLLQESTSLSSNSKFPLTHSDTNISLKNPFVNIPQSNLNVTTHAQNLPRKSIQTSPKRTDFQPKQSSLIPKSSQNLSEVSEVSSSCANVSSKLSAIPNAAPSVITSHLNDHGVVNSSQGDIAGNHMSHAHSTDSMDPSVNSKSPVKETTKMSSTQRLTSTVGVPSKSHISSNNSYELSPKSLQHDPCLGPLSPKVSYSSASSKSTVLTSKNSVGRSSPKPTMNAKMSKASIVQSCSKTMIHLSSTMSSALSSSVSSLQQMSQSPIHRLATSGDLEGLRTLIVNHEADVNLPMKDGTTPIHCAVEKNQHGQYHFKYWLCFSNGAQLAFGFPFLIQSIFNFFFT